MIIFIRFYVLCLSAIVLSSYPSIDTFSNGTQGVGTTSDTTSQTRSIPVQTTSYYSGWSDILTYDSPLQLIHDDETAYRLALAVQNVLFYGGNSLQPFNVNDTGYVEGSLQTAIFHTSPLLINYTYGLGESFQCEAYPNHPITELVRQLVQNGEDPTAVFYGEDVRAMFATLFGSTIAYADQDVAFFKYFPKEDVYIQLGEISGMRSPYPQILEYSPTESGYSCQVVLVDGFDRDTPIKVGDQILNAENFYALTADLPIYQYTFAIQDGKAILDGFSMSNI